MSKETNRTLQLLVTLIEAGKVKDIKPTDIQEVVDMDRRSVRRCLDTMVEAEIATVATVGISNVYSLTIKLPKARDAGLKISKEQRKAQEALEDKAIQKRLKRGNLDNEPRWTILPKFYEELRDTPHYVKADDIWNPDVNYDWIAGVCRECKGTHLAQDFNSQTWLCRPCFKTWLNDDSVFRCDSTIGEELASE